MCVCVRAMGLSWLCLLLSEEKKRKIAEWPRTSGKSRVSDICYPISLRPFLAISNEWNTRNGKMCVRRLITANPINFSVLIVFCHYFFVVWNEVTVSVTVSWENNKIRNNAVCCVYAIVQHTMCIIVALNAIHIRFFVWLQHGHGVYTMTSQRVAVWRRRASTHNDSTQTCNFTIYSNENRILVYLLTDVGAKQSRCILKSRARIDVSMVDMRHGENRMLNARRSRWIEQAYIAHTAAAACTLRFLSPLVVFAHSLMPALLLRIKSVSGLSLCAYWAHGMIFSNNDVVHVHRTTVYTCAH